MIDKYLLYIQIALILLIIYLGNFGKILESGILTLILLGSFLLAAWSALNLGLDTYSPFPNPKKGGKHVQQGAYGYVRHPMYLSIALFSLAFFLSDANFASFLVLAAILYVLDTKATLEEKLLSKIYPTYDAYTKSTKKFLPFIY